MKNGIGVKIIATLILIAVCIPLAACGNGAVTPETTAGDETVTTTIPEFKLPSADYNGHEVNILYVGRGTVMTNDFDYGTAQTVLDNAKYNRNKAVEENYKITIKTDMRATTANQKSPQAYQTLIKEAQSGDTTFDFCNIPGYDVSELAYLGYLHDLNSLPNVDFKNEWWDQQVNSEFSIKNCLFFTTGDYGVHMMDQTYCIAFNKDLANTYNNKIKDVYNADLYGLVEEGKWTIDTFSDISKDISSDLDGNGSLKDANDLHGVLWWDDTMYGIINSAGERLVTVDDEGRLKLTLMSERSQSMVDKYMSLILGTECGIRYQHNSAGREFVSIFTGDKAFFFMTTIGHLSYIRDMKTDYGILPYFKLSEEQESYETTVAPFYMTYLCVPMIVEDAERTGTIIEAIGYYSHDFIIPAYYNKTLVGQYTRDDESAEMLDIIFNGRAYDFGYCYQPANLNKQLIYMIRDRKTNDFASTYETYKDAAQSALDEISDSYKLVIADWAK